MKKKAYLVGIKGVAMTALAVYLKQAGYSVSGSDVDDLFHTDEILRKYNIPVKKGFSPKNIERGYSFVVSTGAHGGMTNVEVKQAKRLAIPTFAHGKFLGELANQKKCIAVAGSHGKTTTSALTASLLTHADYDPSYTVGTASISDLGASGHKGGGKYFVVEADEYMTCPLTDPTPRFFWLKPNILVLTNIDYDHPDAYSNISEVIDTFLEFIEKVASDGYVIVCCDDRNIKDILPNLYSSQRTIITYGFSHQADYKIETASFSEGISFMTVSHQGVDLGEFALHIPGRHNLLNSLAASIVTNLVGVSWSKIGKLLKLYKGSKRRFEKVATVGRHLLFDDYAHHPREIESILDAAKRWFSRKRLMVIFQPHTYSRTKALLSQFAKSFSKADLVIVTDIYPSAREEKNNTISSQSLVTLAQKNRNNIVYQNSKKSTLDCLKQNLVADSLILTLGAGDIFLWHEDIIRVLKSRLPRA